MFQGGFLSGHTTVATGGPGSGKTILAIQLLAVTDGEALYIGFEEREQELRRNADSPGIDVQAAGCAGNTSGHGRPGRDSGRINAVSFGAARREK